MFWLRENIWCRIKAERRNPSSASATFLLRNYSLVQFRALLIKYLQPAENPLQLDDEKKLEICLLLTIRIPLFLAILLDCEWKVFTMRKQKMFNFVIKDIISAS